MSQSHKSIRERVETLSKEYHTLDPKSTYNDICTRLLEAGKYGQTHITYKTTSLLSSGVINLLKTEGLIIGNPSSIKNTCNCKYICNGHCKYILYMVGIDANVINEWNKSLIK